MRRWTIVLMVVALALTAFAPAAMAAPAAGNGSGDRFVDDFTGDDAYVWGVDCGEDTLTAVQSGWAKGRWFDEGMRNVLLVVWHSEIVYTNDTTGDTWIWKDRGPDKVFLDGKTGIEYWTITGRSVANVIGHLVINNETGEVIFVAGQQPFEGEVLDFFAVDDYACDMLTE